MLLIIILLLLLDPHASDSSVENSSLIHRKPPRRRLIVPFIFSNSTASNGQPNVTTTCRWLRGFRHQNKICRKKRGFSEVLVNARQLAVIQCEDQFRYDRWNCSYKKKMFKKVYRETAYMYAITASAITYSTARACSEGKLQNCGCAEHESPSSTRNNWRWGGCGDNIKQAKKIARKFLHLKKHGDSPSLLLNYNSEVGIGTVAENEIKVCTCHGVSASCVMKTCWKRVQPFSKIAEKLKERYHNAIKLNPGNKIKQHVSKARNHSKLLYLAQSPNFCHGTATRRCRDRENCATLCCGRGYNENVVTVNRQCRCRWQDCCFNVKCDICKESETVYSCK